MMLSIQHWDQRPVWSPWLLERFERGCHIEERIVTPILAELGFTVIEAQRVLEIKGRSGEVVCTGHVDGLLEHAGQRFVLEVKSMVHHLWERTDSVADMLRSPWTYGYPWQVLLYCYAYDLEAGLMLLDDGYGHWKLIPVVLTDWLDECEKALARCEDVTAALKNNGELPFHDDPAVCRRCWCYEVGVCSPPMLFAGAGAVQVLADQGIVEDLDRLAEVEEAGQEYKSTEARLKRGFKLRPPGRYLCGDWLVTVESKPRKVFEVPKDVKAQYETEGEAIYTSWQRLKTEGV